MRLSTKTSALQNIVKVFHNSLGVTLVELLVVITVIALLVSAVLAINPLESRKRARDNKRLADLSTLERAIVEYTIDNGSPPAILTSLVPAYISKIPQDPLNTDDFVYIYATDTVTFEINAVLEYSTELMSTDGGNTSARYEIGTNFLLL